MGLSFSSILKAEVLYCVSDKVIGFDPKENYKNKQYNNMRFQVNVDFQNKTAQSKAIYLNNERECIFEDFGGTLYCMSYLGVSLAIHKDTLKFHYSALTLAPGKSTDDVTLLHGQCEKF